MDNPGPHVVVSVPAVTCDVASTLVTVSIANFDSNVPEGTPAILDVDLNGDGDFDDPDEMAYASSPFGNGMTDFTDGTATYYNNGTATIGFPTTLPMEPTICEFVLPIRPDNCSPAVATMIVDAIVP